jgi:hypothetical protein
MRRYGPPHVLPCEAVALARLATDDLRLRIEAACQWKRRCRDLIFLMSLSPSPQFCSGLRTIERLVRQQPMTLLRSNSRHRWNLRPLTASLAGLAYAVQRDESDSAQ